MLYSDSAYVCVLYVYCMCTVCVLHSLYDLLYVFTKASQHTYVCVNFVLIFHSIMQCRYPGCTYCLCNNKKTAQYTRKCVLYCIYTLFILYTVCMCYMHAVLYCAHTECLLNVFFDVHTYMHTYVHEYVRMYVH